MMATTAMARFKRMYRFILTMFKFRANLGFKFHSCKKLRVKIAIFGKKVFENRDFMSKKREITNFKHNLI